MKKLIVLFILLVVSLTTGCGSTKASAENIELSKKIYDAIFSNEIPVVYNKYTEIEQERTNPRLISESSQIKVRDVQTNVLDFLNKEFSIDWTAPEIDGYWIDVSKETEGSKLDYKAFYHDGKMYFDNEFFSEDTFLDDEISQYVLAHELIHYFYDINSKKKGFCLENENGEVLGEYLEEAFVDELAFRYICYAGAEPQSFSSGYKYARTTVGVLSISCPDIFKYFFENDIDGLQEYLNTMVAKRIIVNGDAAEKIFYIIDLCQLNPTENNLSRLLTFLIEMTPKSKSKDFAELCDGIFNFHDDYAKYMQ